MNNMVRVLFFMTMWTFFIYILPRTNGFSRRLNESSKSMIDWQYLSFSFEQGDDSLNENLFEESNTNGHVSVCQHW